MTDGGRDAQAPRPHSPMQYHLPAYVSFGFLGKRAVALDLRADRYFLVAAAETAALRTAETGGGGVVDDVALNALVRRRLLGSGAGAPIVPVAAVPLKRAALEGDASGGRVPLVEAAYFRASAGLHLRLLGLRGALGRWQALRQRYARSARKSGAADDAIRVAQGFADARVLLPAKRLCVPDSLALVRSLWRRGIEADLYFGVQLAPFMAHAWVQRGDILLSDTLNTVGEYTPVFRL